MVRENLRQVEDQIRQACIRSGRKREELTLIAVSKTKPVSMIEEAMACGISEFGENKVQELCTKIEQISKPVHWHLIGHLQTNKVKQIIGKTCLIHSVDSIKLAESIEREGEKQGLISSILLEVNIAKEKSKFGFLEEEIWEAISQIGRFSHLNIQGLMTVAPFVENAEENRIYFKKMRKLLIDIKTKNIDNVNMNVLSMGMTGDYQIAIEEGATMIRVGTGLFGQREYSASNQSK